MPTDHIATETTIRDDFVAEGRIPAQSFDDWFAEFQELAAKDGWPVGEQSDWQNYYDDAYSPLDALREDQSYADE